METLNKKKTELEIKVIAVNMLYEYAALMVDHEINHFRQFIGKDVFKVDGSLKAKYEHEKLSFKGKTEDGIFYDVHCWYTKGYTSFDLNIKICVNGGSYDVKPTTAFCQYETLRTTLFALENNILIDNTPDHSYLNKRYSVEEIRNAAQEIKQAAELYRHSTNKMPYIFHDVCNIERLTRN